MIYFYRATPPDGRKRLPMPALAVADDLSRAARCDCLDEDDTGARASLVKKCDSIDSFTMMMQLSFRYQQFHFAAAKKYCRFYFNNLRHYYHAVARRGEK